MKAYLIQNYGYDAGHSLVGVLLGLALFSIGVPPHIAALLGGLLYAVPKEAYDIKQSGLHLDNVCDLVSYQTSWPAVYLAAQEPVAAFALTVVLAVCYLSLVLAKL